MPTLDELLVKIDASTELLRRELRKGEQSVTQFERGVDRKLDTVDKRFTKLGSGIRSALAAFGVGIGVAGVTQFTRSVVAAGLEMERYERALKFASGSQEAAEVEMNFLRETSDRLGADLRSLVSGYTKLSAAAKGTALEGKGARDIFIAISEASTVLGLSADQTEGALRALEQMISKGNVQAEELRGQLGERLPGAFQIAARAMGVTTEKLNDMLEAGDVAAADLLPKLATELRKTFGPDVEQAADSAQGAINRFNNSIFELKNTIAESGILDLLSDFADVGTRIASGFQNIFNQSDKQRAEEIVLEIQKLRQEAKKGTEGFGGTLPLETAQRIQDLTKEYEGLITKQRESNQLTVAPRRGSDGPIVDIAGPGKDEGTGFPTVFAGPNLFPNREEIEEVKAQLRELEEAALRSQGKMTEAIRMAADEQIAQWMRVAEETPELADEAARAIELINQQAAADIEQSLKAAEPAIDQFASTFAAAFESRGIEALLDGDISNALQGLAKDLIELVIRLTVLKPLAEGISSWFGGFGLGGGTGSLGPPRASGGRTSQAQVVGEFGPEVFVPDVPGRILNAAQLSGMQAANTTIEQHFHVQAGLPPQWQAQLATVTQIAASAAHQSVQKEFGGRR